LASTYFSPLARWSAALAVCGLLVLAAMLSPTRASALGSFCNRSLPAGATCELVAESYLGFVDVEVTAGNGNVCAGADVGGTIHGKSCGSDRAYSEPNIFGRPWVKNNSGSTLTLAGVYGE
jgi:hypothetical protein